MHRPGGAGNPDWGNMMIDAAQKEAMELEIRIAQDKAESAAVALILAESNARAANTEVETLKAKLALAEIGDPYGSTLDLI